MSEGTERSESLGEESSGPGRVRFGPFLFDAASGELWKNGAAVKLQPQPGRLLALLIERAGQPVRRDEIRQHLWGDLEVDAEAGVNFAIRRVRAALEDDAEAQRYVETLAGRGYRFKAPIEEVQNQSVEHRRRFRLPGLAIAGIIIGVALVWFVVGPASTNTSEPEQVSTVDPAAGPARDAYLRGMYVLRSGQPDANTRATALFREALAADSTYAPAYVGIEMAGRSELGESERAGLLEKALKYDPKSAAGHAALGWLELENRQRPAAARDEFEAALALDEDLASAVHGSALAYAGLGRTDVALERIDRGMALDPAGAVVRGDAFLILFWTGQPERAMVQLERALELAPDYRALRWEAAFYFAQAGRWRQCVEQLHILGGEAEPAEPTSEEVSAEYWRREAERLYRGAIERLQQGPGAPPAGALAQASLVIGDHEAALRWLDASVAQDWYSLIYLNIDPSWDPVRDTPEFRALLSRMDITD